MSLKEGVQNGKFELTLHGGLRDLGFKIWDQDLSRFICIRAWYVTIKEVRARDSKGRKFRGNGINRAK